VCCRPQQRTRQFKEPLKALVAGVPQVLTTISGACTGLSVLLASDSIPFGTVVLGSRTTKRLLLSNKGDLGCKFAWETARFGANFSITPAGKRLLCRLSKQPRPHSQSEPNHP
jgi:hydrocephalus-inducing protein